jgi:5-methylcytosine-specific restriction protein A
MPTLPKHNQRPWVAKRQRKAFDRSKGNRPQSHADYTYQQFYNSKRWRTLRNYYFSMNPLCEECERAGFTTPGEDVDHRVPIRLGGDYTSLSNLQTLCKPCHYRKTGSESKKIFLQKQKK